MSDARRRRTGRPFASDEGPALRAIQLRVSDALYERLFADACKAGRSMAAHIDLLVRERLDAPSVESRLDRIERLLLHGAIRAAIIDQGETSLPSTAEQWEMMADA